MRIDRRSLLTGVAATTFLPRSGFAQNSVDDYEPFKLVDIFAGAKGPTADNDPHDLVKVGINVARATQNKDYISIMEALSTIDTDPGLGESAKGSTGEFFNHRWKKIANPLLVLFFHDIGYKKTPLAGDCTPWCAATISWTLKQSGRDLPNDPASSQSFLNYGHELSHSDQPQRGDICVFTSLGDPAHGHVGLWRGFKLDKQEVTILAGNQDGTGSTACQVGYPRSKIDEIDWKVNPNKDSSVSSLYLNAIIRPPAA